MQPDSALPFFWTNAEAFFTVLSYHPNQLSKMLLKSSHWIWNNHEHGDMFKQTKDKSHWADISNKRGGVRVHPPTHWIVQNPFFFCTLYDSNLPFFPGDLQVWQTLIQYHQSLIDLQLMNHFPPAFRIFRGQSFLRSRDGWAVEKAFESNLSRDWIENILRNKLWTSEVTYRI